MPAVPAHCSVGRGPRSLARPRTDEYTPFAYGDNPDFNFRSVRGSAVVRWEFRPGSALYVVWNENRADVAPIGDFSFRRVPCHHSSRLPISDRPGYYNKVAS